VASIREKNGRYEVRVWLKGRTISKTFSDVRTGKRWALSLETGLVEPCAAEPIVGPQLTLIEAAKRYHEETKAQKKGLRQEQERIALLRREAWANEKLDRLRAEDLRTYRNERLAQGRSTSTVRLMLCMVSAVYRHAQEEWGYRGPNPCKLVKLPSPPAARHRRLAQGEEERLLAALSNCRNTMMVRAAILAIETGMRRSELLRLRWCDVDMGRQLAFLHDTKNGCVRWVPLSERALGQLQEPSSNPYDLVVPISQSLLTQAFGHALKRAGIEDLRWHDLRHEALSRWAHKLNGDVFKLSLVSGHKTLQMAQRYVHPIQVELMATLV